jgi:hypothetical protein
MKLWIHIGLTMPMVVVSILHIIQAWAVLTDSVGTTTIIGLAFDHEGDWVALALGKVGLAITYIVFALLAIVGIIQCRWPLSAHVLLWFPQQLLMIFAAISATEAVWIGHYLDGTGSIESGIHISRQHLLADQSIYMITATAHFLSFIMWRGATEYLSQQEAFVNRISEIGARTIRTVSGDGDGGGSVGSVVGEDLPSESGERTSDSAN